MSQMPIKVTPEHLRRQTRRSFLVAGITSIAGVGLWRWLNSSRRINGLNAPFRHVLDWNGAIAQRAFQEKSLAQEYARAKAVPSFRRNGDIGLADLKLEDWRLQLVGVDKPSSYSQFNGDVTAWMYGINPSADDAEGAELNTPSAGPVAHEDDAKGDEVSSKPMSMRGDRHAGVPGLLLTFQDIRRLPHVEMVTEFMCIEGWSEVVHWGGARLRDFLTAYPPVHSGRGRTVQPQEAPEYIGLQTPDGQYYVGIEREVALHPQTLLAYELNGRPLTVDHGAPLRLVTPLKYGIKQIKQIGRIAYMSDRPKDYWYEQGYDYYAGL